jgi:hypothetical protein
MAGLMDSVMMVAEEVAPVSYDASTASTAITGDAGPFCIVRLLATTDCHLSFDGSTANTNDIRLPAGIAEYFKVLNGSTIRAIKNTTAGTLYITRMV